jgi:hypothetical protein
VAGLEKERRQEVADEVQELKKQVNRRLGRRDGYYYVIALAKTTHHHVAHIDDMPTDDPGVRVDRTVMAGEDHIPIREIQYKVIEGRESAIRLILGHMEPFMGQPQPRESSRRASSRRNRRFKPPEPAATGGSRQYYYDGAGRMRVKPPEPAPTGEWKVLGKCSDLARAQKVLRRFQEKYDATPKWKAGPSQVHDQANR